MKKVLITATVQSHIAQFHKPLINILKNKGYEVHIAARNNLIEKDGLEIANVDKIYDIPFERSPFKKNNLKAYKELKKIVDDNYYDVIHCNTPMGGLITRIVSRASREKGTKIIYTAHGFHFYRGSKITNWIIYFPIEYYLSQMTDSIITINSEDYSISKKYFNCKTYKIHGVGANSEKFNTEFNQKSIKNQYGYADKTKIVLCVGELNKNKNQVTLIKSFKNVIESHPDTLLMLAGNGPLKSYLEDLVKELNIENYVIFLGYRTDLEKYVQMADLVISVSKREGLPMNIIEAMCCGKAIIASDNRGHREIIEHNYNGILVGAQYENSLENSIVELLNHPTKRQKIIENSLNTSCKYKDIEIRSELENIYLKLENEIKL